MTQRICVVEGCERPHEAFGWCRLHYRRWQTHGDQLSVREPGPVLPRIRARCIVDSRGCWIWQGHVAWNGYGKTAVGSVPRGTLRKLAPHQATWEAINGPVPKGLQLDHFVCDNRLCANPEHVRPVTQRENMLRGTSYAAINAAKTHCVHDHEFNEANTIVDKNGWRHCRTCRNESSRRYHARVYREMVKTRDREDRT